MSKAQLALPKSKSNHNVWNLPHCLGVFVSSVGVEGKMDESEDVRSHCAGGGMLAALFALLSKILVV